MPRLPKKAPKKKAVVLARQWTPEQQEQMHQILKKQAAQVALNVSATGCVVISFWDEPGADAIHMDAAGTSPWPLSVLFERMALRYRSLENMEQERARGSSKH